MEISPRDRGRNRSMASTVIMAPTTPPMFIGSENSLPPLHQAIPEFHSHIPPERASSRVPRRLVERGSPTFRPFHRVSPSPSSAVSDTSTITTSSDPADAGYDAQNYMFPISTVDSRRMSIISSTSSSYATDARPSPFLPSVASLTPSRGSSFDLDSPERSQLPVTLPSLFVHPKNIAQSATQHNFSSSFETDSRYQNSPHEYRGHPACSVISGASYRAPSPIQYSHPQYYSHSYPQTTNNPGFVSRQTGIADNRSPFSSGGHPVDLNVDHYEHGRPGKRRRGNLPKHVTDLLRGWLNEHLHHPYPTEDEKQMLMDQTELTINQISNWFINARRRRLPNIANTGRPDSPPKSSRSMGGSSSSQ